METLCAECGHTFSAATAPGGMCPRCLLLGGADEAPGADLSVEEMQDAVPGFRVEALLGRGGMGAVFRARQLDLDRDVAIKFIVARENDPAFGERFEREARTMAKLNHPNIISVHRYGRTDDFAYIVMEYVAGGDLAQLIRAGPIPEPVALALVEQICGALDYAHEHGCVHRDIKPGNILIDAKGRVKVADFGLAKLLGENPVASSALTVSGLAVGTPHYAAPEQMKLGAHVDHRADIYALGVMLYEMLTGEVPRGIFQKPSAKAGALGRWDRLIVRAMDSQPERRFGSTAELGRELVVIRRELDFRAGMRRIRWKKPALVAAVLAAAAVAGALFFGPSDFSISRSAHTLVLVDKSGRGGALTISEPAPGRIRFAAADRSFRNSFGWRTNGASGEIALAGVTQIVAGAKGDPIHIRAFTGRVPGFVLQGAAAYFEGSLHFAPNANLKVESESVHMSAGSEIVAAGAGSIAVTASGPIALGKGARLETQDGSLTLLANPAGKADGVFVGIMVDGAVVQATGAGVVSVTGTGGSARNGQFGVRVEHGGAIMGGTHGITTVIGHGGRALGENNGVRVYERGSTIGSHGADVQVRGDGHSGVHVGEHARITAGGSGKVAVTGIGRDPTSGNFPVGVALTNHGLIDSAGGDVSVTGTGGSVVGTDISGVFVQQSKITAGGKGVVTVRGEAGVPQPGSGAAIGVDVRAASVITSADGDIAIAGAGASAGIRLTGDAARIATGNNNALTIRVDSMWLDQGAVLTSGTGPLSIAPHTAGARLQFGGAQAPVGAQPPTLRIMDADLGRITGGVINWGDERTGEIVITEPISEGNRAKLPRGAAQ